MTRIRVNVTVPWTEGLQALVLAMINNSKDDYEDIMICDGDKGGLVAYFSGKKGG